MATSAAVPAQPLKRLFSLLKTDRKEIYNLWIFAIFSGLVNLSLPLGVQAIIQFIGGARVTSSWVLLVIFVIGGIAAVGIFQILQLSISENLQQRIFTRAAFEFAFRLPRLRREALKNYYAPELVNRFFDTLSIQKGLSKLLIDFSTASLQIIFGLLLLSLYHPFFIGYGLVLAAAVVGILVITSRKGLRTSLEESSYKYDVAYWLEEVARTMDTFRLAGHTELPMQKTDKLVEGYLRARRSHFRVLLSQFGNLVAFKVIMAAGLLVLGGLLVFNQQMNIGQFVAAEIVIILIMNSVEKLIFSMETIYDVATALEKIGYVTDLPLEDEENTLTPETTHGGYGLDLQHLTVDQEGLMPGGLKDINLQIKPGEKVAITGDSGGGKTMLLATLAGLIKPTRGMILVDDIPLANLNLMDYRTHVADNLTREDIFRGTVLENITLGRPGITIQKVKEAASISGLSEFLSQFPDGYDTLLHPDLSKLPRYVTQRIILTRLLVCDSRLIVAEDLTTELPEGKRAAFLDHLLSHPATLLMVTRDPDCMARMDRVVTLSEGKLISNESNNPKTKGHVAN